MLNQTGGQVGHETPERSHFYVILLYELPYEIFSLTKFCSAKEHKLGNNVKMTKPSLEKLPLDTRMSISKQYLR